MNFVSKILFFQQSDPPLQSKLRHAKGPDPFAIVLGDCPGTISGDSCTLAASVNRTPRGIINFKRSFCRNLRSKTLVIRK